jgi:hypothetical protein
MERKTQLEPLSTARKKKDLFIAIAGAKRKTPSSPKERDKLNASMNAFFKEIDEGESAPEPAKTSASAKVTNIELVPGPAALPPEIVAELEEGRTARRAVGLVRSPEFIREYVKPKDDAASVNN